MPGKRCPAAALLQRLRPAIYWAPIARRIEKMTNTQK
jgi:hypothetical protein